MALYLGSNKISINKYIQESGEEGGDSTTGSSDDIKFIDYDGTILYSYSTSDFLALSELPANPTHTGLVPQGWNWSLADAKTYVGNYGKLIIGQMYTTASGKTEIDIYFPLDCKRLNPCLCLAINGLVDIDWGDNTSHDILTGSSLSTVINTTHEYISPGNYTILINVINGTANFYPSSTSSSFFKKSTTAKNVIEHCVYSNTIQAIRIGNNFGIGDNAFYNCYSLSSITIPSGVTSIVASAFYNCYSLSSITIPSGVTSIADSAFFYCYSLSSVSIPNEVTSIGIYAFRYCYSILSITIPDGVTSIGAYAFQNCYPISSIIIPDGVISIGDYAFYNCRSLSSINIPSGVTSIVASAFYNCYSLSSITIPSGVTSIGTSAFGNCYGIKEYHLLPTTPPTLASTTVFTSIPSDCIIYVPQGTLETYQTAKNWSTYASYMQELPN